VGDAEGGEAQRGNDQHDTSSTLTPCYSGDTSCHVARTGTHLAQLTLSEPLHTGLSRANAEGLEHPTHTLPTLDTSAETWPCHHHLHHSPTSRNQRTTTSHSQIERGNVGGLDRPAHHPHACKRGEGWVAQPTALSTAPLTYHHHHPLTCTCERAASPPTHHHPCMQTRGGHITIHSPPPSSPIQTRRATSPPTHHHHLLACKREVPRHPLTTTTTTLRANTR
jgi:hypothetical protein